jgi:hypothetical protein
MAGDGGRLETPVSWHEIYVLVRVHCPKCGVRYETTLPAQGVRRVRRCAVCNRTGLEIVDEAEPATGGDAAGGQRAREAADERG